jgi:glucokinase
VILVASILNDAPADAGFMAASIAIGGFLAHAQPVLSGRSERAVKIATVLGGLSGLGIAALISTARLLG